MRNPIVIIQLSWMDRDKITYHKVDICIIVCLARSQKKLHTQQIISDQIRYREA